MQYVLLKKINKLIHQHNNFHGDLINKNYLNNKNNF